MSPRAANCPAEVRLVMDISDAGKAPSPTFLAAMPNVKETARYPMAMGRPSWAPCRYQSRLLFIIFYSPCFSKVRPYFTTPRGRSERTLPILYIRKSNCNIKIYKIKKYTKKLALTS